MKQENYLALDNEELRRLNNKKVFDTIENVGSFAKWFKHYTKIKIIKDIVYLLVFFIFIVSILYYVGFKEVLIGATPRQEFICYNPIYGNATFNLVQDVKIFQEIYPNSTCGYTPIVKRE